jgi:GT2 family glycosyltransferase
VAFLDADDAWDAEKLAVQTGVLDAAPDCVAVGTLMRYVSSTGRPLGTAGEAVTSADQARIARGELQPFQLSSLLVRRRALVQIGGFDETLGRIGSEDLDLVARLAEVGAIAVVPQVLGAYRIHGASAMARHRTRINRGARFVRARIAARRAGGDLQWDTFVAAEVYGWRERRRDWVERCYRRAALRVAERRMIRAAGSALLAAIIDPVYTVRRARRQLLAARPAIIGRQAV